MKSSDLQALMKRVVEIVMPDLRKYYRVVRKAKVVKSYASDGSYWADVQPLRNDESADPNEPVIPRVEIPVLWGGPDRGVVCPPAVGTLCDLEYYDGDPNYPRISNFRWQGNKAPVCDEGGFIIQFEPGVSIEIGPDKNIVMLTPENSETEAGKNWTVTAGENVTVIAGTQADIQSPLVNIGNGGGTAGVVTMECNCNVLGVPHAVGSTIVMAQK